MADETIRIAFDVPRSTLEALRALFAPAPEAALLPVADAAREAKTTERVIRDAIRGRELPAYGKQRDRAVRRADLEKWIESRRVVHAPIDDRDIERRMANLKKRGKK